MNGTHFGRIDLQEDFDILKEFSEIYPRVSWSPSIYLKKCISINLHINLHTIEGFGSSVATAKIDAVRKYYDILSTQMSIINKGLHYSEMMMKNYEPPKLPYCGVICSICCTFNAPTSDCSKNSSLTLSSSETLNHIDKHLKNDKYHIQCEFERAYKFLSNWSNVENSLPNNESFKITLNIGDYRFKGCGRTLNEAKFDAIKKFYMSSINNFFEISDQNETETILGNTPSNDQSNSSHYADTKPSDCCSNSTPFKRSEEPDISQLLQSHPDENNTSPLHSFMATYNLRNSIWSPVCCDKYNRRNSEKFRVALSINSKLFIGIGRSRNNAKLKAVNKLKDSILNVYKHTKKETFIENIKKLGAINNYEEYECQMAK